MSSEEDYSVLYENFKWCAAVMNVLLQQEGGLVEISQEVLESIDLSESNVEVRLDEIRKMYIIERKSKDAV